MDKKQEATVLLSLFMGAQKERISKKQKQPLATLLPRSLFRPGIAHPLDAVYLAPSEDHHPLSRILYNRPGPSSISCTQNLAGFPRDRARVLTRQRVVDRIDTALLLQNRRLLEELHRCKLNLADASLARQQLGQQLRARDKHAYVSILIDGENFTFHDDWITQGVQGGRRASHALQAAIQEHFGHTRLHDFTVGFIQNRPLFDFVALDQGNVASGKLQETVLLHLQDHSCRHVILGMSDCVSNLLFLHELEQTGNYWDRVTVLPVKGLLSKGFGLTELCRGIFCTRQA
ncbi:hypothetical protein CDD80_6710 [Ophiocordyceps camponoti-rufipedis]|uniref:DUF7923 domain-containing protein n=1 Tax=Ophiocordyceps camponoti-rufipedis TaxID=2004952 RepID=A0A2C5ZH41_9HYPO|nr:hypothetical protein CDD80_6710 [Ophiocordyceps camponoti-rufipedis]